jgi:hypothetical protein
MIFNPKIPTKIWRFGEEYFESVDYVFNNILDIGLVVTGLFFILIIMIVTSPIALLGYVLRKLNEYSERSA